MLARCKYLVIVLIFFTCLVNLQVQGITSSFSTPEDQYLYFDQTYNVIQRLRTEANRSENLMSEEDKKPVEINIYEVSVDNVIQQFFLSQFIEKNDLDKIMPKEGKLLVPVLVSDYAVNLAMKTKFGQPKYLGTARKVLSHSTYFIEKLIRNFDTHKIAEFTGGYFVKFAPNIPGFEEKSKREILINDYIKSQVDQLPESMRTLVMDSFASLNLSLFAIPFSLVYRSADRIVNHKANTRVYPGHGLLGCEVCVKEYAQKWSGLADPDKAIAKWKQKEYLPKIAKYLAYAHHVLGVSFEAHTQNILIEIDHNTGNIVNIFFRDFADILLNPIPLLSESRFPKNIDWEAVKLLSIHPNYYSDQSVQVAKNIWYHVAIYSGQAVTSHIQGFQRQQRYLLTFLEAYILETEKILGQSIPLSEDALLVIDNLKRRPLKENFYGGELQERSPLRNAMASILKPIFAFSHKVKLLTIESDLKNIEAVDNREFIKRFFIKTLTKQRVIFMGQEERNLLIGNDSKLNWFGQTTRAYTGLGIQSTLNDENLDFKIYQDRIWVIDSITQRPLATTVETYRLINNRIEQISISRSNNLKGGAILCKQLQLEM